MENPIWNLIIKVSSAIAAILLVLATGLILAAYFQIIENSTAGVITTIFATVLGIFSLFAVNYSHTHLANGTQAATEVAHRLSQGELFENEADTDLLE